MFYLYSTDKKKLDSVALAVCIRCVRGTRTLRLRFAYVALAVLVRTGTCAFVTHALRMRCACDVKFLFVSTVVN